MATMMARASLRRTMAPCAARIAAKPASVKMAARPRAIASRRAVVVRAAADGGAAADPYQVMGLKPGATSEQIQRAYNKLRREKKGDEAALAAIEAAHSSLMMSQLTARMQGNVSVDSDVKFADRAQFFPWRPRVMVEEDRKKLSIYLACAAVLAVWTFASAQTAFTQPLIASTGLAIVGHYLKQCQIFPPGGQYATPEEKKNVSKNLIRAFGLGLCGLFCGTFLSFTLPDLISAQIGKTMPVWFYESQSLIINLGGIISNFVLVSCFR